MATPLVLDEAGVIVVCPSCSQKNRLPFERLGENVRCAQCKTQLTAPATPDDG